MSDQPEMLANPAEPAAPTKIPEATQPAPEAPETFSGYPKTRYHPVLVPMVCNNPNELAMLTDELGWRDTPEQADANRTATEAWVTQAANLQAKLAVHDEAGQQIQRNSAQAHQAIAAGKAEPL